MSFSSQAKAELCRTEPDRGPLAVAECYGALLYAPILPPREIRFVTGSPDFARRLPKLFSRAFSIRFDAVSDPVDGGKHRFLIKDFHIKRTV